MKKTCLITFHLIVLFQLVTAHVHAAAQTVTVTDMAGRQVKALFNPERIVCIGPGTLRLIVYLKAEPKVVGIEDMEKMNPNGRPYWIAHPELSRLPRCGPGGPAGINKKPDLEVLLTVNPQVIFVTYMDASLADAVQRTLGIPMVVLSYGSFASFDEAVYDALRISGKILNREKRAEDVVNYIESMRKDMRIRTKDIPQNSRPAVYVGGIGYRGIQSIESSEQHFIPFEWLGANNIARHVQATAGSHVIMDREILLKLNPDVIFVDGGGSALVMQDYRKKSEFYHALNAFTSQRVYILHPFNWYTTNIGTALADAYAIGKIICADAFQDVNPEKKADEIYTFLVGKPVYEAMKKTYGKIGEPLHCVTLN